jgi:protein-S-isoprenylcysteine O-methyltransferase Ste14
MQSPILIRVVALYLPIAAAAMIWLVRRPGKRQATAALLAGAWCIVLLLPINLVAPKMGWWHFEAHTGLLAGVPIDMYLGWALLWGPVAALAFQSGRLWISVSTFALLDLLLMPLAKPVLALNHQWLVGELVSICVCLVPAQILAHWTTFDIHVQSRAVFQAIIFSGLTVGVIPAVVFKVTSAVPRPISNQPMWLVSLFVQVLAIPAVVGLSAVQEFAARGHGTPLPYDPPVRLVTTGVYRYTANPMQLALSLTFFCLGALLASGWIAMGGLVAFAYGAGIARWSEDNDMAARFGLSWPAYKSSVRAWLPGWRPRGGPCATIYVAGGCEMCRGVGAWIARRNPIGLAITAAERHPTRRLKRITYECAGYEDEGMAAFARALEHVNLAWALAGCAIRLPVIRQFLQLVVDASGGGPRDLPFCVPWPQETAVQNEGTRLKAINEEIAKTIPNGSG